MHRTVLRLAAACAAIVVVGLAANGVAVLGRYQPDPEDGLPEAALWWLGAALVAALSWVALAWSGKSGSTPGGFPVARSLPPDRPGPEPAPATFRIRDGDFRFESSSEREFLVALAVRAGRSLGVTPDWVRADLRPAAHGDDLPEAVITVAAPPDRLSDEQFERWAGDVQCNLWKLYPAARFVPAAFSIATRTDGWREASFNIFGVVS
jgi:hypothetical protein